MKNFLKYSSVLTIPQGDSQEGSPGLEAFQRAKSVGLFFSSCRSAETLSSPEMEKTWKFHSCHQTNAQVLYFSWEILNYYTITSIAFKSPVFIMFGSFFFIGTVKQWYTGIFIKARVVGLYIFIVPYLLPH